MSESEKSSEYDEDNSCLVIDNGSSKCKGGFSGNDAPCSVVWVKFQKVPSSVDLICPFMLKTP